MSMQNFPWRTRLSVLDYRNCYAIGLFNEISESADELALKTPTIIRPHLQCSHCCFVLPQNKQT